MDLKVRKHLGEPPLALGLSTCKALSVLKEQLEAALEGHLRDRKKRLTWKGVELVNASALFLLLLLNLLLIGRQDRLKR
uniref:Transmembrane protein 94 n=1 Tax=Cavia porcellus TaxID=10141 RepID=A0A286XTD9_CAVPO